MKPNPFIKKTVGRARPLTFDEMTGRNSELLQILHNGIIPRDGHKHLKKVVGHPRNIRRPVARVLKQHHSG